MPERPTLEPWLAPPHRVARFYPGGEQLDAFRDLGDQAIGAGPEDWVASTTRAWSAPGVASSDVGIGTVVVDGRSRRLLDLIQADPLGVLGPAPADPTGNTTGLLVKLLDAGARLPVHVHPDRSFARRHLGSAFGKTEAWIVLATREQPGAPPPNVRLGFHEETDAPRLRRWLDSPASTGLLESLHARPATVGDVWLVPAGTPHAIGAGVFLLELQEPTDFSILLETEGVPIAPADAHLGLGWEVAMDSIDRRALSEADLDGLRGPLGGGLAVHGDGWLRRPLLPPAADAFFRAERLVVSGTARPYTEADADLAIGVVTAGAGRIGRVGSRSLEVRRGATFVVPAASLPELELEPVGTLEVIVCRPPSAPIADVRAAS